LVENSNVFLFIALSHAAISLIHLEITTHKVS